MKTFVVIPAYNEAAVLGDVVAQVRSHGYEVAVVDDGSSDATAQMARQAGAHVVRHFLNRGQGAALQTAISYALLQGADIVVTYDADGQHHAEEIKSLIEPIVDGKVDAVLGSRFLKKNNIPGSRSALLKVATFVTKMYTGATISDVHNGLRAFSKRAAAKITITQNGYAHASEIIEEIVRHEINFTEAPVTITYTDYSKQKGQKLSSSFRILWDLLLSRITR